MASLANHPDNSDKPELQSIGTTLPLTNRKRTLLVVTAIIAVVGLVVVSDMVHDSVPVRPTNRGEDLAVESAPESLRHASGSVAIVQERSASLPSRIIGEDGSTLRFVPEGRFRISSFDESAAGQSFQVSPVYMGETEVTNAQYVAFLNNRVLDRITVLNAAVVKDGHTLLVLGEVFHGYEPIVFRDGEFAVNDRQHSTYPVVQVTANGALAYAQFHGARLPTEYEGYAAVISEKAPPANAQARPLKSDDEMSDLEREMIELVEVYGALDEYEIDSSSDWARPSRVPHSVSKYPPNAYGIRGLRGNIAEWGLRSRTDESQDEPAGKFVILGGIDGTWLLGPTLIRGPAQSPDEAFVSVGFRVAMDASAGAIQQKTPGSPGWHD